jgi:hypothetical protein
LNRGIPPPTTLPLPSSPPIPRKPHIHSSINNQQPPHWIETTRDESGDAGTCLGRRRCTRRGGSRDGLRRLRLLSSSSQRLGLRTRGGGAEETTLDLRGSSGPGAARRGGGDGAGAKERGGGPRARQAWCSRFHRWGWGGDAAGVRQR